MPERAGFSMASPFICESENSVSRETWKVFDEAVRTWDEPYKCVAWTGSAGRDSEVGYKLFAGFDSLPAAGSLAELMMTLDRRVGPVTFTAMIDTEAEVQDHGR